MSAHDAVNDLVARLGGELGFDVARDVACARGMVDVVWMDARMPLAAVAAASIDLDAAPVLPVVAFVTRTACELGEESPESLRGRLEGTCANLRIIVLERDGRAGGLAPALQSIDQMRRQDDDLEVRSRIAAAFRGNPAERGRTIVMLQSEVVEWARHVREVKPRSYSAESLFHRIGVID